MKQFMLSLITVALLTGCESSQDFASISETSPILIAFWR